MGFGTGEEVSASYFRNLPSGRWHCEHHSRLIHSSSAPGPSISLNVIRMLPNDGLMRGRCRPDARSKAPDRSLSPRQLHCLPWLLSTFKPAFSFTVSSLWIVRQKSRFVRKLVPPYSNTPILEVLMTTGKRKSGRSTRRKLSSPGRPPVWQREHVCRFWREIAAGLSSEEAAVAAGVSAPVGTRWFRSSGGTPPTHLAPSAPLPKRRSLSFSEREEIALECARGTGLRAIARKLGRSASTISREIRRSSCVTRR